MPLATQFGWKAESVYGTPVVVDRFFEVESFEIVPEIERIEPPVRRSATRGTREDRFVPVVKGYAGSLKLPVMTLGFGALITQMTGVAVVTTGPTDSTYTHTYTLVGTSSMCGDSFTAQGNMPIGLCGETDQAFTWEGGKVASWTLSCEVGGVTTLSADLLFENGLTATALATASYPTGMEFFSWPLSQVTIATLSVPVTKWSVTCNNNLNADRHYIRNSSQRKEPTENGEREITFSCTLDFEAIVDGTPAGALGVYNKLISATAAGAVTPVVIASTGPTVIAATSYPTLTITMDKVRVDGGAPTMTGPEKAMIDLTGKALVPVSGTWLSLVYKSSEATP